MAKYERFPNYSGLEPSVNPDESLHIPIMAGFKLGKDQEIEPVARKLTK